MRFIPNNGDSFQTELQYWRKDSLNLGTQSKAEVSQGQPSQSPISPADRSSFWRQRLFRLLAVPREGGVARASNLH
jgi:hypothetical protein